MTEVKVNKVRPVFPPRTTILPGKLVSPPHRTMLALQLVGGFAAGFNLPASLTSRNVQPSISMAVPRASRREALSIGAAAAAFIVASPPRAAFASQDPNDLNRFKKALTGVNYLLDNWDVETTECKAQAGGSGECTDQPDKVRYYFGLRTTDHPLFQLDKLYAKAQAKLPDDADFEEWIEATEGLASQIAKINELAYTCAAPARALLPIPLTAGALDTDAGKHLPEQVLVWRVQPRRWQGAGPQVPPPLPGAGNKVQGVARDHRQAPQDLGARKARSGGRRGRGPWHDSSVSGQVGHDERPPAAKCDRRRARTAVCGQHAPMTRARTRTAANPLRRSRTYFPHLFGVFP